MLAADALRVGPRGPLLVPLAPGGLTRVEAVLAPSRGTVSSAGFSTAGEGAGLAGPTARAPSLLTPAIELGGALSQEDARDSRDQAQG